MAISPFLIFFVSFCYRQKILYGANEEFNSKWGSLFEEFKNDKGFFSTQFYFIFMIRRILYSFSQIYLNSQREVQNALNILGTILTLAYIFKYYNYKEKGVLICEIIGEIGILLTMILSLAFLSNLNEDDKEVLAILIMILIFTIILIQILICVAMVIIEKVKKLREKKNIDSISQTNLTKSGPSQVIDTSAIYSSTKH